MLLVPFHSIQYIKYKPEGWLDGAKDGKKSGRSPTFFLFPLFSHRATYCVFAVDPMFMIVKSVRSFLNAVTTTAVAPIAVIYLHLHEFTWINLNLPEYT